MSMSKYAENDDDLTDDEDVDEEEDEILDWRHVSGLAQDQVVCE